jgi:hypothetical protein
MIIHSKKIVKSNAVNRSCYRPVTVFGPPIPYRYERFFFVNVTGSNGKVTVADGRSQ